MDLESVLVRLAALPQEAQQRTIADCVSATRHMAFVPLPGPQSMAYLSKADVLLFGGSVGGGKTALGVGLALNEHRRSLIVRKAFVDLDGVLHTLDNILGRPKSAIGGNRPRYESKDGKILHFMGMSEGLGGKQGNPHDLIYIDEAAQLPEDQVRILMGWLRTDTPGQRTRVVMGSNPPLDTVGDWLVDYFAPWLDDTHPNPAEPGELRYFLPNDNGVGSRECGKDDKAMIAGIEIRAQSRTFIPSSFTDNPFYDKAQYAAALAGLPDSVRDKLISGNFMDARQDDPWQAIPAPWVREAVMRWQSVPPVGVPQCALGVDIAQGGSDEMVIAARHDGWFAPLVVEAGKGILTGPEAAGLIIKHRRDNSKVVVDIGGGWGGDAYAHLVKNGIDAVSYMGVKMTTRRTEDNQLHFFNVRSMAYWRFHEALNPSQPGGSRIQLPNDKKLISDLTTPKYSVERGGIRLESKEDVVERLGRSPDRGDAVVMSWYSGDKMADSYQRWQAGSHRRTTKVVMGYQSRRR